MREQILMNYGDFEYTINENDEVAVDFAGFKSDG